MTLPRIPTLILIAAMALVKTAKSAPAAGSAGNSTMTASDDAQGGIWSSGSQPDDRAYDQPHYLSDAPTTAASAPEPYGVMAVPQAVKPTPPLPFHTIEGYGGGAITPMAYLINGGPKNTIFGLPSVALSYVNLDRKDLVTLSATETILDRVELGFSAERLNLGNLPDKIRLATGVDINEQTVWLYNFNARFEALPENSFNIPFLPAVTAGFHFKRNDGISAINNRLGGALSGIGYRRDYGEDFTVTASKTLPKLVFGRPLILTAGLRVSEAAQLGFLGFSDNWEPSFEGNVVFLPTNWLLVGYEYRQKRDPYGQIPGLIGPEDDWHAVDVSLIFGSHATFVVGYGHFGTLANAKANDSIYFQLKYEL